MPPAPYPTHPRPTPSPTSEPRLAERLGFSRQKGAPLTRLAERLRIARRTKSTPIEDLPGDGNRTRRDWRPRVALPGRASSLPPQPTPEPEPEAKPTFPTKRVVAASVGAVAVVAFGIVGFAQSGGPDELTPQAAAAHPQADPVPRDTAPKPPQPAPLPVEDAEDASDTELLDPAPAPIEEPNPEPIVELPVDAPPYAPAPEAAPAPGGTSGHCLRTELRGGPSGGGAAPIHEDTPGFVPHLDRKNKGVGCE